MTKKVLIADNLANIATETLESNGIDYDKVADISEDQLIKKISDYDGILVRSKTKVSRQVIEKGSKLKVIGRAGIGVDTIDIEAASKKGIVVMNTPFGNAITTAEHTLAMMFSLARNIPQANHSTKRGLWEKSKFLGTELYQKTLAVIGFGTIGSIVATRALGLEMKVLAYDPFLSDERAKKAGVIKVSIDELLAQADVITVHTPLTNKTKNLLNLESFKKCKPSVIVINCARGGIINEADLATALENKYIKACALDVFEVEPATNNELLKYDNLICTPHLGASTLEAQENVSRQIAEQVANFLNNEVVANAVNFPSLSQAELIKLKPILNLVEKLGSFSGQIAESSLLKIEIEYAGLAAELNHSPLNHVVLAAILSPFHNSINQVNSLQVAKDLSINFSTTTSTDNSVYNMYVKLKLVSENRTKSVVGTIFSDKIARIIAIDEIDLESKFMENMLFIRHHDKLGMILAISEILSKNKVNIATMALGRHSKLGDALVLIGLDNVVGKDVIEQLTEHKDIILAKFINF